MIRMRLVTGLWLCAAGTVLADAPQEAARPAAQDARAVDKPDKPDRSVDAELLRSLEKQTTVEPAEASPLERIGQRMRSVQGRLARADAGTETRELQGAIVEDIDKLIEALKKGGGCPNCGGTGCSQCAKRNTSANGQQQQKSSSPASDSDPQERQAPQPPDPRGKPDLESARITRAVWGHLPDKLKEEMQQAFKELVLPKYEAMIEQYFRTIAEQNQKGH